MKAFIKETFIIILLLVVIALILAVMFYDYFPMNKVVPEAMSYTMPEELSEVKNELDTVMTDDTTQENISLTLSVTEEDLAGYKQTKTYEAGKADPFAEYTEPTSNEENNENNNIDSNSNQANNSEKNSDNGNSEITTKNDNSESTGRLYEKGNTK